MTHSLDALVLLTLIPWERIILSQHSIYITSNSINLYKHPSENTW